MRPMQHMPFVSVIIPCYNCEKMVEETFVSLQKQTYKHFEVICVNDGSKDNTAQILESWRNQGLNLNIINQTNGGVSRARNNGIAAAKGEYILFLDSDDIYHPEYIRLLVEQVENYQADTAYCGLSRDLDSLEQEKISSVPEVQDQTTALRQMMLNLPRFGFCCYLYKKDILDKYNLQFPLGVKFGEDREFLWMYLGCCQKAVFVNTNLYGYRINENSVTHRAVTWEQAYRMDGMDRVMHSFEQTHCTFAEEFRNYMYPRTAWSIAKDFATLGKYELLLRFAKEYDLKTYMHSTLKDRNILIALSAFLYLVNENLFFHALRIGRKLKVI